MAKNLHRLLAILAVATVSALHADTLKLDCNSTEAGKEFFNYVLPKA